MTGRRDESSNEFEAKAGDGILFGFEQLGRADLLRNMSFPHQS